MNPSTRRRRRARRLVLLAVLVAALGAVARSRRNAMAANAAEFRARYGPGPTG
jgi:hypothetical protein